MLFGLFKPRYTQEEPGTEEEQTTKPPTTQKSGSVDEFMNTPRAKSFIKRWSEKRKGGKKAFTKRGVLSLLRTIFMLPSLSSDDAVFDTSEDLLTQLGGMDGLNGFLLGMKAKSEGIMKAVKTFVGRE